MFLSFLHCQNALTFLNLHYVCCLSIFFRFGVDISKYPTINKIKDALVALPAFVAADAARQPDTPEDQRAK